ncbi:hypothetical protein FACS1894170_04210 [Planctomycetales bacterium]|nr:hypothetical protein FACS1894170_04210 [Planctomycetales bacterium]
MKHSTRPGFTLIEILIVMAIIAALFALLLPGLFNRQQQAQRKEAQIKVQQLGGFLEQYNIENRGYPTTEQGLNALIYVPDNVGVPAAGAGQQTGLPGTFGTDPTGGMGGNAVAVGPDMLNNPAGGAMPNVGGGMAMTGNDPNALMTGGMTGTGAWNQPVFNPALYTQLRKRPAPYVDSDRELIDPWGTPYRYDNSLSFNGANQTGTPKPAIWSAGPDKIDNTDDDLRNWDPVEAQRLLAQRQSFGGQGQNGSMIDPMTGQPSQMNQNPMNPTGTLPGNGMLGQPNGLPAMPGQPAGLPGQPAGLPTVPTTPATTPPTP